MDKTLREQIETILRAWQNELIYPDEAEDQLLDLIREHDKRVIGEDDEYRGQSMLINQDIMGKNYLREEQRKRSEIELKG